jgi:riboflavin kinase/FMN adenylyltransferase
VFFAPVFDRDAANMLPECYIGELVRRFHPVNVVCGFNHSYGKNGAGSAALLEMLGGALGFDTCIVPQITYQGQEVSSSIIRRHLQSGEVSMVRRMLGRPYSRKVAVARENGVMKLDFANDFKQPVKPGLYRAALYNGEKRFPVMVNSMKDCAAVVHGNIPEGNYQLQYFC